MDSCVDNAAAPTTDVFVYQWICDDRSQRDQTFIRAYGLADDNDRRRTVCINVEHFTPYFYIEFKSSDDAMYRNHVRRLVTPYVVACRFVERRRLYATKCDNGLLTTFLHCFCASRTAVYGAMWQLRDKMKEHAPACHEHEASTLLQLAASADIDVTGWLSVGTRHLVAVESGDRHSRCDAEYRVDWKLLKRCDDVTRVPRPRTLAFDLEVNSETINAFPSNKPGDEIFQISCVVQDDDNDVRSTLISVAGQDFHDDDDSRSYDVVQCPNELGVLRAFIDLLRREMPNAIIGYNILGFDLPYLIKRCERYHIVDELRDAGLGTRRGDIRFYRSLAAAKRSKPAAVAAATTTAEDFNDDDDDDDNREEMATSSTNVVGAARRKRAATNEDGERYVYWEGIVIFDLLPLIVRDHRLANFKLDTVAREFLGDEKDDVGVAEIFEAFRTRRLAKVGRYCVQDSMLCVRLFRFHQYWIAYAQMSRLCSVQMFDAYTCGQQLKVFSLVYRYCTRENILVDADGYRCKVGERYVGAHVIDPTPGRYERVVPFDFQSMYPTIILAYNVCFSTVAESDRSDDDCHVIEWDDHVGCEHDPKIVAVARLNRAIEASEARCRQLRAIRDDARGKTKDERATAVVQLKLQVSNERPLRRQRAEMKRGGGGATRQIICAHRRYRFVRESVRRGVVPTIVETLLNTRRDIRARLKTCVDEAECVVLDKRQWAYKILANSVYGAMGVRSGYLPFMPAAMCVTYIGRTAIEKALRLIRDEWSGSIVYGDTDSNYVTFPASISADIETLWTYALRVAADVSSKFPPPMRLDFEGVVYDRFLILCKKRYVYRSIARDGVVSDKIGRRGVVLARRNNPRLVRDAYERVVAMIFDGVGADEILYAVVESINDLFRNRLGYDRYVATVRLGDFEADELVDGRFGDYRVAPVLAVDDEAARAKQLGTMTEREYYVSRCPAQVQLADRMRRRGVRVDAGSRIEYVVIRRDDLKGGSTGGGRLAEKMEDFDYFRAHSRFLRLDKFYYLKAMTNPIDQLLKAGADVEDFVATQTKYRTAFDAVLRDIRRRRRD